MQDIQKLPDLIASHKNITLIAHERPDGDAIGSLLAFAHIIGDNFSSCSVNLVIADEIPDQFSFLPNCEKIGQDISADEETLYIFLDIATPERAGRHVFTPELLSRLKTIVNIDHHESNSSFGNTNIVDLEVSSTCELLFQLAQEFDWTLSPQAATCLLAGIYTDTGGFLHATSPNTFFASGELVKLGADNIAIANYLFRNCTLQFVHDLGELYSRTRIIEGVAFCSMFEVEEDVGKEIKSQVSYITSGIQGVRFSCVLAQYDSDVRGSLRSKNDLQNLSEVAGRLGGGGHAKASGFTLHDAQLTENGIIIDGTEEDFETFVHRLV